MIPAAFEYHAPGTLDEAIGAAASATATTPRCSRAARACFR